MLSSSLIFILEIIIKFKTAFFDKGEIVSLPLRIVKRYFLNEFFGDCVSVVGLLLGINTKFFSLLFLLRIRNLAKYFTEFDCHFFLTERFNASWTLLKLFLFIVAMAHYFACLFHFTAIIMQDFFHEYTWLKDLAIENESWKLRYNYALYF